jgi:hypothetical protein
MLFLAEPHASWIWSETKVILCTDGRPKNPLRSADLLMFFEGVAEREGFSSL